MKLVVVVANVTDDVVTMTMCFYIVVLNWKLAKMIDVVEVDEAFLKVVGVNSFVKYVKLILHLV